ncbi:DUF6058 family natural product biosynthesis protein [Streptomyces sp. NBC_01102]|nr:DUF6058 family natural product biosynthesis protein [Streptomyces sp. NBC_01102]
MPNRPCRKPSRQLPRPSAGHRTDRAGNRRRCDELDTLRTAFTGYDRLRFSGPTSRDTCVDAMRARLPRQ